MHSIDTNRPAGPAIAGREGLRELVRRPLVRVLLVVSAVAQVVAVGANERRAGKAEPGVVAQLSPWVVEAPAAAPAKPAPATAAAASEATVTALAADYRAQGFAVSGSLARTINEAAQANDIAPDIAFGLVRAESGFKNTATSRVGAIGLTQLMPGTARWLQPGITTRELRDPKTNASIGFKYLRQLIDRYEGDVDLALTAYNRGPGTVDRVLKRGGNPDNGYADFVRTGKRGKHRG